MTEDKYLFLSRDASLERPNAFVFSVTQCGQAYRLNQFAIALRDPVKRAHFVQNPREAMTEAGLSEQEITLVETRDWGGLVEAGVISWRWRRSAIRLAFCTTRSAHRRPAWTSKPCKACCRATPE